MIEDKAQISLKWKCNLQGFAFRLDIHAIALEELLSHNKAAMKFPQEQLKSFQKRSE